MWKSVAIGNIISEILDEYQTSLTKKLFSEYFEIALKATFLAGG
jgi:hypothetical protein